MRTYDVTITATVTKTLRVEAEDADAACEVAHGEFTTEVEEGYDARYSEDTVSVIEVTE